MFKLLNIPSKPQNYKKIDNYLSRSAQPDEKNILWLKKQGITDIINFRTMAKPDTNFDEKSFAEKIGIKYHHIPSITMYPKKENVGEFLDIVEGIKGKNGKVHIHCKAGADRTGMYSYIYERLNNIGSIQDNIQELTEHFWHKEKYPYLNKWAEIFVDLFKK